MSQNAKSVAFWDYFSCIPISIVTTPCAAYNVVKKTGLPNTLPVLSPLSFPLSFHLAAPLPKEVNKKLSYRGQNALSIIKHMNAIPPGNTYCFIGTPV